MGILATVHFKSPSKSSFFYQNLCHGALLGQIWVKLCKMRIKAKKKAS